MNSSIRRARVLALVVVSALALTNCHRRPIPEASAEVAAILNGPSLAPAGPHSAVVWKDVQAFYQARQGDPAWISKAKMSKSATAALEVVRNAPAHGLNAANYDEPKLTQLFDAVGKSKDKAADKLQTLAEADVRLTAALLALGRDVAVGRTSPEQITAQWKSQRKVPDLPGTLNAAVDSDVKGWLDSVAPHHPEYTDLTKALAGLRAAQATTPGTTAAVGYDLRTPEGIKAFQEHHGLKVTGVADAATKALINIPIEQRIRQVELNLERWRWMPDDFGAKYFIVNIPLYHLYAVENGKVVKDIRVVVGKPGHETPIFSDEMTTVVFSPYWNIPDSIAEGETAPAMAKNPQYLASHHIDILRRGSSGESPVDPASINWDDPSATKDLAFRQRPGADNALGHVKFLFPNPYNVYLHDTPADDLFARPGRAFSHGCIRVEEPETLAKYVLRDYPEWPEDKIFAAMNAGVEKQVALKEKIPVHIVYFTAWVDDKDGLHFQPDIYGYDPKQMAAQK
jgi:murein L,D-transpeptidase YcbB/YkuD